jgi:hypothetical protein
MASDEWKMSSARTGSDDLKLFGATNVAESPLAWKLIKERNERGKFTLTRDPPPHLRTKAKRRTRKKKKGFSPIS